MPQVNEHPEILLYTRIRKSPYFYASRRHGVQLYSVYNHMYHPRHYGDPVAEYWQLLNGVTLWDVGGRAPGRDQRARTRSTFTNMLVAARPEQVRGRAVQVRLHLPRPTAGSSTTRCCCAGGEPLLALARRQRRACCGRRGVAYNSGLDVTIKELDVGPMQIQGPKSKDVMVDLFGDSILEIPYYYLRDRTSSTG